MKRTIFFVLTLSLLCLAAHAQDQSAEIRQKVDKIGIRENVTVKLLDGKTYHGFIQKIETDTFTVAEVDLRTDVTFKYSEVKKVETGYGPKNLMGKRINPHHNWIPFVVLGAALAIPIIIVATAKD